MSASNAPGNAADSQRGAPPDYLTQLPRWVLWRRTPRVDRKTGETTETKVPISRRTGKKCDVTDPQSWADYAACEQALARTSGAYDGSGCVLGLIEERDEYLIALDLDACLNDWGDPKLWAVPFLTAMPTYTEISVSGTGLHPIARIKAVDLPAAQRLLEIPENDKDQARTRIFGARANGAGHAPGAQLFLMKRYFAITGRHWPTSPEEVRLLTLDQIAQLAAAFGPNDKRRPTPTTAHRAGNDDDTEPDEAALRDKLGAEFLRNPALRYRWEGGTDGLSDASRSGRDLSVLAMLVGAGFAKGETRCALRLFEHGKMGGEDVRYFERMWARTQATPRPERDPGYVAALEQQAREERERHTPRTPQPDVDQSPPPSGPNPGPEIELPPRPGPRPKPGRSEPDEIQFIQPLITPIDHIPPRQWAYGRFLLFGSAAVIGALDGTGKGYIAVAIMLAMITGRDDILGEKVWRRGPVAIVTYEDGVEEWQRRFAAACLQHDLDYETVMKSVHFIVKPRGRVVFAQNSSGGITFPDSDSIVQRLRTGGFVLMLIDPFNNAHALEDGNNNVAVAAVAAEMSRIARAAHVAVLVLHHLRKGAKGDPDDLMGALMLRANFRSCRIFQKMTAEEAGALDIPVKDAWRYIRLSGTKENYAVPADKATWIKLETVGLDNGADIYPEGDFMGVAVKWEPPAMFEGMNAFELHAVFAGIDAKPHAAAKQATIIPWIGRPLVDIGNRSEDQASKIVAAWKKSGVLIPGEPHEATNRKTINTLKTNPPKVVEILGSHPVKTPQP